MPKNANFRVFFVVSAVIGVLICSIVFAAQLPKWFHFSQKDALYEWDEKIFKNRVLYAVEVNDLNSYLSAYSNNSASGIFYRLKFNPKEEPMVSWKWKVVKFPEKNNSKISSQSTGQSWIEKDDYAARFYVIFPKVAFNLTKTLEYVWDKELPKGAIMTSPYFKNIKIIVAESGDENKGEWVYEERNVYEDFKKCFGSSPSNVGAVAIMTDTDNTLSTAEAYYDEIRVGYKNDSEQEKK
ncbi:MAG: DUF3047 domain-containing protein [Candidatus Omnitrophota bacterium]